MQDIFSRSKWLSLTMTESRSSSSCRQTHKETLEAPAVSVLIMCTDLFRGSLQPHTSFNLSTLWGSHCLLKYQQALLWQASATSVTYAGFFVYELKDIKIGLNFICLGGSNSKDDKILSEIRSISKILTCNSDANEEIILYFKRDILYCSDEEKI